jgi:hypothetical protein
MDFRLIFPKNKPANDVPLAGLFFSKFDVKAALINLQTG